MQSLIRIGTALTVLATAGIASALTISDSTFAVSDWALTQNTRDNGGTVSAVQTGFFGNPVPARLHFNFMNAGPSMVASTNIYQPTQIDPSATTFNALAFQFDVNAPQNFHYAFAVQQGGTTYLSAPQAFNGAFATQTALLLASDFYEYTPFATSDLDLMSHPDFTGSGAPIGVGFWGKFTIGNGGAATNYAYIADNFSATTQSVPEPATLAAVGIALAGLARKRRRA